MFYAACLKKVQSVYAGYFDTMFTDLPKFRETYTTRYLQKGLHAVNPDNLICLTALQHYVRKQL